MLSSKSKASHTAQLKEWVTKRRYLRLCLDMWKWIAVNPTKDKYDYLESVDKLYIRGACWACHHLYEQGIDTGKDTNCNDQCILKHMWPLGCTDEDSAYTLWRRSHYAIRDAVIHGNTMATEDVLKCQLGATEIVVGCYEALATAQSNIDRLNKTLKG